MTSLRTKRDSPSGGCSSSAADKPHLQLFFNLHPVDDLSVYAGSLARRYGLLPRSRACVGAQLTANGAAQHLHNGWHLRRAYLQGRHQLLGADNNPKVRPTAASH